jgi:type I restriction enzyme M protein
MYDAWDSEERVTRVVSNDEIRENDYNMNIALYVDTTEPQPDISVTDTLSTINDIETEYNQLNQQLQQYMQQLDYTTGDTE